MLSSESAISSMLDMSIRLLPGDHGLPLQQVHFFYQIFSCSSMASHLWKQLTCISRGLVHLSVKEVSNLNYVLILQALPDVPPAMANAVNRGSELLANLTVGTPWETVAKEVGNTLGVDSRILRANISKDVDLLVDVITAWTASNSGPKLLRP